MEKFYSYSDLNLDFIKNVAFAIYGKDVIDVFISGSYAYCMATRKSDCEVIVATKNPVIGFEGTNCTLHHNSLKYFFVERGIKHVHNFRWLKKYHMPMYSIKEKHLYEGNLHDVIEWRKQKEMRNAKNTQAET